MFHDNNITCGAKSKEDMLKVIEPNKLTKKTLLTVAFKKLRDNIIACNDSRNFEGGMGAN